MMCNDADMPCHILFVLLKKIEGGMIWFVEDGAIWLRKKEK